MLIYNSTKEFIGIDEYDLKIFGFSNLSQLRSEAADFADLFVRTPGYVHNFKHVHWIDFVSYAESADESRVIISIKSKSYTASLSISKAYLTDKPNSEAYFIALNGLRPLSSKENEIVASGVRDKPIPVSAIDEEQYKEMIPDEPVVEDDFDFDFDIEYEADEYVALKEGSCKIPDEPSDLGIDFEEEEIAHVPVEFPDEEPESFEQEPVATVVTPKAVQKEDDDGYVFDPKVASDELGLPVDLIEEFIEDFIGQAKEFKAEMYSSLEKNDIDNVAILSHKLKGVAANLRIENALSAITTVNISKDPDVIKTNLDLFYRIMRKLGGGDVSISEEPISVSTATPTVEEVKMPDDEDDFVLDFKDDEEVVKKEEKIAQTQEDDFVLEFKEEAPIEDVEAPEKIDMPDLDDDLNLATDIEVEESPEMQEPIDTKEVVEVSYSKELSANAIGLDMETFEELFTDYIKDSREISSKIHQALAQNNLEKCAKEARILKGMSTSMQVKEFTLELESLISVADKNEMTKAIEKIDNVIEQISKKG